MSAPSGSLPRLEPTPDDAPTATLTTFIEERSKLITSIAAFIALTVFSSQINDSEIRLYCSGLAFLAAVTLTLELLFSFPPKPRHWRLELFSLIIGSLVGLMGWYWFKQFTVLWIPLAEMFVVASVFFGIAALVAYPAMKLVKFIAARIFHAELQDSTKLRQLTLKQVVFAVCLLLVFSGLELVLHKSQKTTNMYAPTAQTTIGK